MKAEDAKLPGAGISPKPCLRKYTAEKGDAPDSVRIGMRSRLVPATSDMERSTGECSKGGSPERSAANWVSLAFAVRSLPSGYPPTILFLSVSLHLPCLAKVGKGNNGYKNIEEFLPDAAE